MDLYKRKQLIAYLSDFTNVNRLDLIDRVLNNRTNHIAIVLEDLHKSHNANAVLRSCEALGIQDIYIIENENIFDTAGSVSIGAHKWLTLHRFNKENTDNTEACFNALHEKGYRILATTPHEMDSDISEVDIKHKTALVFGTELDGISERAKELADGFVKIPMYGFSESYNISVSAAICMYELTKKLRNSEFNIDLDEEYRTELKHEWIRKSIKAGKEIEERYLSGSE